MKQKDKFLMLLALSCLPLGNAVAEQVNGLMSLPIHQEVLQNTVKITGQIVDSQGEPIIGATVMEMGTTNGIVTDLNGNFSLNVSPTHRLQISYVGFQTQELSIGSNRSFRIVLKEDAELLEEVVVVGYGSMKKSDLTGAIASVKAEKITASGLNNAVGSLQGNVAGVNIVRSNTKPGGGYDIKIRGLSSISKSNAPLIVVDGVPGADLENINPDDIEKMDILKDASATAIYGSRGANGVIIVSTKRGKEGKPQISYSGYAGFRQYTNVPDMMEGDAWVQHVREAYRATNNNEYKSDKEIFQDASEYKAVQDHNYFDWLDAGSSNAFMTNHSLSVTGGTEIVQYALSGGYYSEDGMVDPQMYERYNIKASVDVKITHNVKAGVSMYFTNSKRDTGNSDLVQELLRMRPTQHPNSLIDGKPIWAYTSNGRYNPLITEQNELNQTKKQDLLANVYLAFTPIKGLEIKSTFSPFVSNQQGGQYRGRWTNARKGSADGATAWMRKSTNSNWVWDNIANYKWKKNVHALEATGVFSMQKNMYEELYGNVKDIKYKSLWYNLQGGAVNSLTSKFTQTTLMSYLARLNYTLMDRYLFTVSGRYDGSSKLAEGHKWAFFPSAAVAWRVNEEAFMKSLTWLSNLKFRASYGQIGNDAVDAYGTLGTISNSVYTSFGTNNVIGNLPNNLKNDKLTWEKTTEWNLGLDFGLFNNRISGSIEYYNRLTTDLIMSSKIPTHLGYSSINDNVGSVRNQGVEVTLNTTNIMKTHFNWSTTFTMAYNKNEIVDLDYKEDLGAYSKQLAGLEGDYSNLWIIGKPINVLYNYQTLGVWQLDEAEKARKYGQRPGQFKVRDFDGDGQINSDKDRFLNGQQTPTVTGGMTNNFKIYDFDFGFHVYWQLGGRDRNQFMVLWAMENNNDRFSVMDLDYWTPENPSNTMAQPSNMGPYRDPNDKRRQATHNTGKTNFLKCSYMTLGYTFKKNLLKQVGLNNLRMYATVQNPFLITGWTGFDPEQPQGSLGGSDLMTRNFIFGLNVSF